MILPVLIAGISILWKYLCVKRIFKCFETCSICEIFSTLSVASWAQVQADTQC